MARARVVRLDTGQLLPDVEARGPLSDLFGVFGCARAADSRVAGDRRRRAGDRLPPTPQVFELYVKGLVAETPSTALAFLEQALKAAPQFDRARLAIWELHSEASEHQRALDVVSAIRPESRYSREGRFRRALSLMNLKRFDDALQALRAMQTRRAIGDGRRTRSASRNCAARPRFNRAARRITSARRPSSIRPTAICSSTSATPTGSTRIRKAAIYWLREAVRRDPGDGDAHFILGVALQQTGATAEATRERELAHAPVVEVCGVGEERRRRRSGAARPRAAA